MKQCAICDAEYKETEKGTIQVTRKRGICRECAVKIVQGLFSNEEFNEWLDSFMQSRLAKYIPGYNEFYVRYKKMPCPDCKGTGFIGSQPCKRCGFVGVVDAVSQVEQEEVSMKYFVNADGKARHIENPEGGVTLCGLELEFMQTALNEKLELPICKKCKRREIALDKGK
jgi:hypothetical protein